MRNPAFVKLLDEIKTLHENKNHDYAQDTDPLSNLRKSEAMGIPAWKGVLVRLTDKWSRIEQLANGKEPKNESLRDSLIDNAVYSLLCVLLLEESTSGPSGAGSSLSPSLPPMSDRLPEATTLALSDLGVPSVLSGGETPAEPFSVVKYAAPGTHTHSVLEWEP